MKKVLVTGANGMLGQDLCLILKENGYKVIPTVHTTANNEICLDITDFSMVQSVLSEQKPDIVIHCAAYTNVDKAEEDYDTAHKINVNGTENIAKVCAENDITLVYISTDYVFDGESKTALKPTDKINPINNYGLTKLLGEQAVRKYCKKYYIARTSWLYGIYGTNFVETMIAQAEKAKAGVQPESVRESEASRVEHNMTAVVTEASAQGTEQSLIAQAEKTKAGVQSELKVVDDQIGCPTWTVDLCKGILKLLHGKDYGTYHLCGGGQTSWYGFAKEIFRLTGLNVNLVPCTTDEFPRPAKRPKYSVMDNQGLLSPWQDALADYINYKKRKETK